MQLKASALVPIAALMNYHKPRGLKDTNLFLYSFAVQKLEMGLTRLKSWLHFLLETTHISLASPPPHPTPSQFVF